MKYCLKPLDRNKENNLSDLFNLLIAIHLLKWLKVYVISCYEWS